MASQPITKDGQPEKTRFKSRAGVVKARARSAKSGRREHRRPRQPDLVAIFEAQDILVFIPGHVEYERAVACSNLLYRFSRPTYVIRPQTVAHVQTIVTEAKERNIPITIKNGGHSYSGSSFPNDGIMLDLKDMSSVHLDKQNQVLTVEGGALWGNVYRTLVDNEDGLMINGGRCPSVGVSGFILGGGIGPFSRSLGMGVDSLIEVTIVAADGETYTVTAEDAADTANGMLFWALCGAGGGNFGVVVEMKLRVYQLADPDHTVVAGRHTWFPKIDRSRRGFLGFSRQDDDGTGLIATMNHFYTTKWPEQMTIDSSWLSDLEQQNGDIGVRFLAYFDGTDDDFSRLINKGILNKDLGKHLKRRALPEPTTRFLHETLFAQWDEETKRSTPANSTFRLFSSFCFTNDLNRITKITAIIKEELEAFKALFSGESSGLCQVSFIHAGGQTTKRERSASAFRWRETIYHAYIMLQWKDKWLERDMRGFAKKFKNRLKQYSIAGKAAFVNFPDASLPQTDFMKSYYGNNRDKLQQVKHIWDEDNFFRWDQSIMPARNVDATDIQAADNAVNEQEENLSDGESEDEQAETDLLATERWESRQSAPAIPMLTSGIDNFGGWAVDPDDMISYY
ncbi:hypothetical protein J7T55_000023 [Diaporthe amygdali]|uniref:uncharacterized protein n=1 Tax=Phomopsis amygdali TaxID=1214568 RepID=UPI0022FEA702|nr:uncharacterized protein J7T55_000023 [Diaporthe amygdali]KAJ0107761.1 hypothetical protein J7T55_000023 [Diaporthe amygdali]